MDIGEIFKTIGSMFDRAPAPMQCTIPDPEPASPPAPVRTPPASGWSKNILDCHPLIRDNYDAVRTEFRAMYPGCDFKVDYTYRSPSFQFELFKKGRSLVNGQWVVTEPKDKVTNDDGINKKGHHNVYPSQAADVYIVKNGDILWGQGPGEAEMYIAIGRLWEAKGLVSGATWRYQWKDPDHIQVSYEFVA